MAPSADIHQLSERRSELHRRGDVAGAIPLQVEILRLLEERGSRPRDIANAHNYLSVLYRKSGDFPLAEIHARRALALHERGSSIKDHDSLATYSYVLARILCSLGRQTEAVSYADAALKKWALFHDPTNDFLKSVQNQVAAFKSGRTNIL
jgi:tetratricopeptide (TPR) repeat protein